MEGTYIECVGRMRANPTYAHKEVIAVCVCLGAVTASMTFSIPVIITCIFDRGPVLAFFMGPIQALLTCSFAAGSSFQHSLCPDNTRRSGMGNHETDFE